MGKYRLGDIICMTRKALSITQEQLCEGICSVGTLSRLENGRQNPSRETYELLMERMGRSRSRAFSILSISDYQILEKLKLFEDCISIYDYIQAEKELIDIKKILGKTDLDRQFLLRAESIINYRLDRISSIEFLKNLEKAIRITIPQYGNISLVDWPFIYQEIMLIINISSAYANSNNYNKAIEILEEAHIALKQSYMDEQQRVIVLTTLLCNLSKWYGLIGEFNKAIEVAKEGIDLCKTYKIGNVLPNLLYGIVWNIEQQIDNKVLSQEAQKECFMYLKQAYYIACAMQQPFIEHFLLERMKIMNHDETANILMN